MAQQLYIKGVAVDMPAEEIKIKVESNLFSDADKIKTAHSYNVCLPRTATNDNLMALAFLPASESGGVSTHCYLPASLFVDGVPLFEQGQAVLTSVNDKGYNLTLLWGLLSIFDEIKREGLNLCDLPMSGHWDEATMAHWIDSLPQYYFDPHSYPEYVSGMTQDEYSKLDEASKDLADETPWILPSVYAQTILNTIQQVYGVRVIASGEASQRISLIAHPLVTRKVLAKNEELTFVLHGAYFVASNRKWITLSSDVTQKSSDKIFDDAVVMQNWSYDEHVLVTRKKITASKIRITGQCDRKFRLELNEYSLAKNAVRDPNTGMWTIDYTWYDVVVERDKIFVTLVPGDTTSESSWDISETPIINIDINVTINSIDDAVVGDNWCYERNYPDMGVVAYINEILAHIGGCIVGSVNKPNSIYISTFDEVMASQPQSLQLQGVNSITMTLGQQAQKNIYTHKANDDDGYDYTAEGVIYTADETLAMERKAFDSKFKVPVRGIVRLWEIEEYAGENNKNLAKWVAKGDYIASNQDGNLYDFMQDFKSVIGEYYTNFEKMVAVPKVVEAIVRMSIIDLLNIDLGRPVYVGQLGRQYLIESIETESNNQYKLKLVQI